MEKDTRLFNLYLKIYHKKPLMLEDLAYLAKYDPECFEKTCKNVVYNIPEAKSIMEPDSSEAVRDESKPEPLKNGAEPEAFEWQNIEKILENLKRLERNDFPVADIDADKVKNLLGNLYMEMLFPHNDKNPFGTLEDNSNPSLFDKKV